jgi:hypothetical protein
MARPESTRDIELDDIEFGNIELRKIATDPLLLKGYTAFVEAVAKAGAIATDTPYSGVSFTRRASQTEAQEQLRTAQSRWDDGQRHYQTLASVGELEYNYHRTQAEEWAKSEDMPFPPEHDPIAAIDAVIRDEVDA